MKFEWDEDKNAENLRRHGFDFADAWQAFHNPMIVPHDDRVHYGEERWIGIGMMSNGVSVVLVFTERGREMIRIISMRRAKKMKELDMRKQSKTDWARIKSMKDRDINFSDIPELDDDFFAEATLWPGKKKQITIRIDPDVVEFFRRKGRGYQSSINAILRRYMEVQQRRFKNT